MDKLDSFLTDTSRNNKLQPAIRVSTNLAKETLNCYYSYMDMSKAYCIAMGESHACSSFFLRMCLKLAHGLRTLNS